MTIKICTIFFPSLIVLSQAGFAKSLDEAVFEAADSFKKSLKTDHQKRGMSLQIINLYSKKRDKTSIAIETNLILAFKTLGFKIIVVEEALSGASSKTIGMY